MADMDQGTGRYTAFLSYSHKDAAAARWLHRRLETYRVPRRLVGTDGERGPVPVRLTPIFRDREELPAAGDLSEKVRAALAASDNLIVICSPNSAASPWVAKEIAAFRELHPERPILAAIAEGEPGQCFPAGLAEGGAEPLAADLRSGRDGRRLGFLKLVAGLTGLGLDALVQRDAQRRVRRVTAVTAGALAAMLMMAVLTAFALSARSEAQRQRVEAEGLVEFMLTDLRDRLEGVGRLDVLTAVNRRALDYYQGQDLEDLSPDSLERRARILHAMGEDDEKRGNLDRALAQFREAARTTGELLEADPNNPERLYGHAQSEYWVGYIDYQRRRYAAAKPAFERYKTLADRLVASDSGNPEWVKEAGYAEGNLCSIALAKPADAATALRACSAALRHMERAASLLPEAGRDELAPALANRHGWLGEAYKQVGDEDRALAEFRTQEKIIERLLARDSRNFELKDTWLTLQFTFAAIEQRQGDHDRARTRLTAAKAEVGKMIEHDPSNKVWRGRKIRIDKDLSNIINKGEIR